VGNRRLNGSIQQRQPSISSREPIHYYVAHTKKQTSHTPDDTHQTGIRMRFRLPRHLYFSPLLALYIREVPDAILAYDAEIRAKSKVKDVSLLPELFPAVLSL
jgi:hypothetical protein